MNKKNGYFRLEIILRGWTTLLGRYPFSKKKSKLLDLDNEIEPFWNKIKSVNKIIKNITI